MFINRKLAQTGASEKGNEGPVCPREPPMCQAGYTMQVKWENKCDKRIPCYLLFSSLETEAAMRFTGESMADSCVIEDCVKLLVL